jgi:LmbE family N-acetylglucosaminyl deacetylase
MKVGKGAPCLDDIGTTESAWSAWSLDQFPLLELGNYHRVIFVAPHPDDEVLAAAGLMQRMASRGIPLTVVAVTDGEASHPHSRTMTPMVLADIRARERCHALDRLGISARVFRLALPDGAVAAESDELTACLRRLLEPDVLCVAPWEQDGHPDHDVTGAIAQAECAAIGAPFLRSLVWTWHWAVPDDQRVPWPRARRLPLSRVELMRKRWAVASFTSQIEPLSDEPGDEAILPPATLARFDRRDEVFLV